MEKGTSSENLSIVYSLKISCTKTTTTKLLTCSFFHCLTAILEVTVKVVALNSSSPKKTSQERLGGAELLLGLGHQLEGLGLVVGHDDEEGEEGVLLCNELSEGFGERFPSLHNS